jgi:hypothetical protein
VTYNTFKKLVEIDDRITILAEIKISVTRELTDYFSGSDEDHTEFITRAVSGITTEIASLKNEAANLGLSYESAENE